METSPQTFDSVSPVGLIGLHVFHKPCFSLIETIMETFVSCKWTDSSSSIKCWQTGPYVYYSLRCSVPTIVLYRAGLNLLRSDLVCDSAI